MRTTLDIDAVVLKDLKRLQKSQRKSLGRLASDLLAEALGAQSIDKPKEKFKWPVSEGRFLIDILDKDALWKILDDRG